MRVVLSLLLTFALAGIATAADGPKPLSRSERKERTAKLSEKHRQFLIDVDPIIQLRERDTFLRLETDPQRDAFIEDFWRRRDVSAGTTNHAARDQYMARLDYVREHFGQASSDRGRVYLVQGPPEDIIDIKCLQYFQPIQVWKYERIQGLGSDFRLLFYVPNLAREYKLWDPMGGERAYRELMAQGIEANGRAPMNVRYDCPNGEELQAALAQMKLEEQHIQKVYEPPKVDEEQVGRILRSVVLSDPNAPKLNANISIAYPSGDGSKTNAQLTVMVPRSELKTTTVAGTSVYTVEVIGEVLRDEKMWERYRYRFDFPGDVQDAQLPIVIDRMLKPAKYQSRIKISDASSTAQTILENELDVPEVAKKETVEGATVTAIQEDLESTRAKLRIVPLGENVLSGLQTIHTISSGAGIKSVEFWLDGRKVATRRTPPYTLDLDFGTVPRSRKIRVVALDSHDQPITGDEIVVNTGTDPFRVRIASPRIAPKLSGPTKVELDVKVPEGKELNAIELYWNETRVATLYDPPFVQTVTIPATDGVGYLRAVATLKDTAADPVEDVVMVNTPDYMETVDVHLVELPTTVLNGGKPVNGLTEASFKVLDQGEPVKLAKFEYVKNLPLSVGMAVDTSGSMDARMNTARDAGAAFFKNVLRKEDKAFLVGFDSQPHMVQKWSSELNELYSALAKLRPEESTALYDAIVYSLYNFLGVKGQKALIVVTDGKDTISKFTFDQTLEYAQRAAVPIYAIGIAIPRTDIDIKGKLNKLAGDTGGSTYYIENAAELSKIYSDIENELRSQYLLGFYPPAEVKTGGQWREVTVQVAEGKAKTIRGYYP
ncbi:MAG TPA: VWA domain-containing protein [Thermoanaerobaculia bacterium]|nr:VWA domain-containing protein [Thermoanaerobaculia bacterium]